MHCHLLNYEFIPDSFFKTRAPFREWLLRGTFTRVFFRLVTALAPGVKYDKIDEVLDLLRKEIYEVAAILLREMEGAGVVLATPLMVDLEIPSFNQKPELPYTYQIKLISNIALKYPGVLMPFIMADPRRPRAADLIIRSLEQLGFLGVKIYPPLGHHPDPTSHHNEPHVNAELHTIYKYCEENAVPITVHCSPGGAYSSGLMFAPEVRYEYAQPWSWAGVLQRYPDLYLNLAHFGGDFLKIGHPGS